MMMAELLPARRLITLITTCARLVLEVTLATVAQPHYARIPVTSKTTSVLRVLAATPAMGRQLRCA